jgi:hypothetical protein
MLAGVAWLLLAGARLCERALSAGDAAARALGRVAPIVWKGLIALVLALVALAVLVPAILALWQARPASVPTTSPTPVTAAPAPVIAAPPLPAPIRAAAALPFAGAPGAEGTAWRVGYRDPEAVWALGRTDIVFDGTGRAVPFTTGEGVCDARAFVVFGAASSDGPTALNRRLAAARAESLAEKVREAGCPGTPAVWSITLGESRRAEGDAMGRPAVVLASRHALPDALAVTRFAATVGIAPQGGDFTEFEVGRVR